MYEWINTLEEPERTLFLTTLDGMERDVSAAKNPITAGFTQVIDATPTIDGKNTEPLRKTLDELRNAYFEEELATCQRCNGQCPKSAEGNRWFTPQRTVEDGETVWRMRRCKFGEQRKLAQAFRNSGIPNRYVGKKFSDYVTDAHNRDAVYFAQNIRKFSCGAYFFGECGTGKTFLASLIAQDFLNHGESVLFVKVPGLLDAIKSTFDGDGNELDMLEQIAATTLVVLDDFGMEKPTQWAGATLCKILDMRYDNPGKTLVTSNFSIDELADRLDRATDGVNFNGSRIADRLREICKPVLFDGLSRRV